MEGQAYLQQTLAKLRSQRDDGTLTPDQYRQACMAAVASAPDIDDEEAPAPATGGAAAATTVKPSSLLSLDSAPVQPKLTSAVSIQPKPTAADLRMSDNFNRGINNTSTSASEMSTKLRGSLAPPVVPDPGVAKNARGRDSLGMLGNREPSRDDVANVDLTSSLLSSPPRVNRAAAFVPPNTKKPGNNRRTIVYAISFILIVVAIVVVTLALSSDNSTPGGF
ncbi:hypothetical protein CYMTET_10343 [Cymbomonas tetramitiformis]|uniref:Uncharacterized protein n=1 Tax=Cymbomonas tetramitiformis TaxID=36881 RepID=A0AAE0LE92_9CHLO|nr:hypothetical protein CYMTET_10343 [Cymbomonas tetramitiformis]